MVFEAEACMWKALAETLENGVAIGEAVFKCNFIFFFYSQLCSLLSGTCR